MTSTGLRHIATEPASLDLRYSNSLKEKMERSPRLKQKSKSQTGLLSDSEISGDSHSLSADSIIDVSHSPSKPVLTPLEVQKNSKSKWRNRGRDWEIVGGLKDSEMVDQHPPKSEGFLLKKRKWPLKGWHKRYFVLDKGILVYAKRPVDITRGKPHGTVDLGQSVISAKTSRRRIDIDAEVFIYHIKVKSRETFVHWVDQLKVHRLYRQHIGLSNNGSQASPSNVTSPGSSTDDPPTAVPSGEASEVDTEIVIQPGPPLGALSCSTGRRTRLPAPMPSTEDLSLWNLLRRNIGKDLSKVSMPVALNEPISMLQRLCEELEYCELLDKAAETEDPYERLVLVTAFAVSPYGSSHFRAGHKPFNPLLGETFECVREDKGFRFMAEQVSHHPPVSVCHASSNNYEFWQDTRIKTKFWGKSMEFQPLGTVNVILNKTGDHYRWNKVTTCVHNLFGGSRWVDQYGEMVVTASSGLRCQLTFVKASYWSSNRHEVYGTVLDAQGKVVHSLFGKWSEGLYWGSAPSAKCVWRPAALPEDHELYYGFSRFTIELNELEQALVPILPDTDSRFRPDQRLLEEGQVNAAENMKLQLEQAQRERRTKNESDGVPYIPRWFRKVTRESEEYWEFIGNYWEVRNSSGFSNITLDKVW